ncbi:MAG TPA: TIGR01777 family oxidoreductase, partial [Candidatus Acidoferrales bacterium]
MRVLISGSSGMVGTAVSRLLAENGYTVSRLLRHQSAAKIVVTPPAGKPVESHTEDETQNEVPSETQDTVENEIENEIENEVQSEGQAEPLTDFPNEVLSESPGEVQSEAQSEAQIEVQEEVQSEPQREVQAEAAIPNDVRWNPVANEFDAQAAEGADAVVHLAGASIGGSRWTNARKALLRSSRVDATRHLVDSLSALNARPKIFVGVSAVGYYGDRGDEKLTDHSGPGADFLAQICKDWERESSRAAEFGARVVILRFGIILSTRGGALPKMLTPIKMFVGGKLGSGQQWMSWLSLDDATGVIRFVLENESARG